MKRALSGSQCAAPRLNASDGRALFRHSGGVSRKMESKTGKQKAPLQRYPQSKACPSGTKVVNTVAPEMRYSAAKTCPSGTKFVNTNSRGHVYSAAAKLGTTQASPLGSPGILEIFSGRSQEYQWACLTKKGIWTYGASEPGNQKKGVFGPPWTGGRNLGHTF